MKSHCITTANIQPYRILAGLLLATISLCIANQAASQSNVASEYFPLDAGNYWTFEFDNPVTTSTTEVLPDTVPVAGIPTKVLQYQGGTKEYYTSDGNGIRLHQYLAPPDPASRLDPPAVLANSTMSISDPTFSTGIIELAGIDPTSYELFYDTISEVLAIDELVTVPFGTFEAVKVKFTLILTGTTNKDIDIITESTYWLVHQLGPVKQHIKRFVDFNLELDTTGVLVDTNIEPPIVEEPKVFLPFLPLLLE